MTAPLLPCPPCPFCGGQAQVERMRNADEMIVAHKQGCFIGEFRRIYSYHFGKDIPDVPFPAWNRRTVPAVTLPDPDDLPDPIERFDRDLFPAHDGEFVKYSDHLYYAALRGRMVTLPVERHYIGQPPTYDARAVRAALDAAGIAVTS